MEGCASLCVMMYSIDYSDMLLYLSGTLKFIHRSGAS